MEKIKRMIKYCKKGMASYNNVHNQIGGSKRSKKREAVLIDNILKVNREKMLKIRKKINKIDKILNEDK